jgi:hypothetical protein
MVPKDGGTESKFALALALQSFLGCLDSGIALCHCFPNGMVYEVVPSICKHFNELL